jgi:hypothetical protein
MTKTKRRINDFSSGIRKLNNKSLSYINKLTQILFMVEQPPVYPGLEKKAHELEKINIYIKRDKF